VHCFDALAVSMPFDRFKTNRQEEAIGASKSAGSNNSEGALGGYRPDIDCVGMKYSGIVRKTIRIRCSWAVREAKPPLCFAAVSQPHPPYQSTTNKYVVGYTVCRARTQTAPV
jgi:hypothetical protein